MMPQRLSQLFTKNNILLLLFASFLIMMVLGMLNTDSRVAYAEEELTLDNLYHIYLNDQHIGDVDDAALVTAAINEAIEKKEADSKEKAAADEAALRYGLKQTLNVIEERVFLADVDNEATLSTLEEVMEFGVRSTELMIGEKSVGYFKNSEAVDTLIKQYKGKFVDEEILDQFEATEDEPLVIDNTTYLDIRLSEAVMTSEVVITEEELLTIKQGLRILEKGTLEDQLHTIVSGDTVNSIANQYNLTKSAVFALNEGLTETSILTIDDQLNVTDYALFVDVIVEQEKQVEEVIKHDVKVEETAALYKGDSRTKQEGVDGTKDVDYNIALVNGKVTAKEVIKETVTKEPVTEITEKGTKVIPSRGTGNFSWPAVGGYLSSSYGPRWGSFHKGIDIARPANRNIVASDNGTVERISYNAGGYGHYLVVNHNNGYKTLYAHLSSISVNVGQSVPKGTVLGQMGSTGRSTGIHLHFEVIKHGSNINPAAVLN